MNTTEWESRGVEGICKWVIRRWTIESKLGKGGDTDIKVLETVRVEREQLISGIKRFWELKYYEKHWKITLLLYSEFPMAMYLSDKENPYHDLQRCPTRSTSSPPFNFSSIIFYCFPPQSSRHPGILTFLWTLQISSYLGSYAYAINSLKNILLWGSVHIFIWTISPWLRAMKIRSLLKYWCVCVYSWPPLKKLDLSNTPQPFFLLYFFYSTYHKLNTLNLVYISYQFHVNSTGADILLVLISFISPTSWITSGM